jgi:hypothetical protein
MTKAATAGISLADLNLASKCDAAYEFEYLDPQGRPTGVFLSVLGSQSQIVQKFVRQRLNEQRARQSMMQKRGKEVEATVEDDEEFANDAAAVRLVGWRGITEPYSPALALELVSTNSELRGQVFKASNDLGNFNKS